MASLLDARLLFSLCSVRSKRNHDDPLEFILSHGIDESQFEDDAKECFNWILEQSELEDALPTVSHLSKTFRGIDFAAARKERDTLKELVQEFKSSKGQERLAEALSDLLNRPKQATAAELVELLDSVRAKIPLQAYAKSSINDTEGIEALLKYKERTKQRLPLPWSKMNKAVGGYTSGVLSAYVAPPGSGKTYLACINALHFMMEGLSVGLVSLEDPEDDINERLWAMVGKLSPMAFQDQLVGPKKTKRIAKTIQGYPGELVVYTRKETPDLRRLERAVTDAKHDVVVIDAMYLLNSGQKTSNDFDNNQRVLRGLEAMAGVLDIPVIGTSQYGSTGVKVRTAGFSIDDMNADGIRFGRELEMTARLLLAFYKDPHSTTGQLKILKASKSREVCVNAVFETNWNLQNCDFSEIGFRTIDGVPDDSDDDDFQAAY